MNDIEKFFKAFARDRKILGEDLTVGIYEDIFSYFMDKPVKGVYEISNIINEDGTLNVGVTEEEILSEGFSDLFGKIKSFFKRENLVSIMPDWLKGEKSKIVSKDEVLANMTDAAEKVNAALGTSTGARVINNVRKSFTQQAIPAATTVADAAATSAATEALSKGKGIIAWLGKAKNSIKNFFKGNNIKNLLNNGIAWATNPANIPKILGGAGGVVLLTIIIKSLKKRKMLKKYPNLEKVYNDNIKEGFEYSPAFDEIVEEAKTNEKLYKLIFTDEFIKKEYKNNYMNY